MSKKYIKLEQAIKKIGLIGNLADFIKDVICDELVELPTIEIVHCGECKCCRDELIEEYMPLYIYCEKWNHETDFDGFCSAGEWVGE